MTKPTTFEEAYALLDQAINEQPQPALGDLVNAEIEAFRGEAGLAGRELATQLAATAGSIVADIDREIRANPLLFIGGAAALAVAAGFVLAAPPKQIARAHRKGPYS